jgi:hypothetical protein
MPPAILSFLLLPFPSLPFLTVSRCVAKAGLKLSPPVLASECWDYRHVLLHPVSFFFS